MFKIILILTVICTNTTIYLFLINREKYKSIYLKTTVILTIVSLVYYFIFKPDNFNFGLIFVLFLFSYFLIPMHFSHYQINKQMDQFTQKNKENQTLQNMREHQKTFLSTMQFVFFPAITIIQIIIILSLQIRLQMIHN